MDRDLNQRVGEAISYRMKSEGIAYSFFAREIHSRLGLTEVGAIDYLRNVRNGLMYGWHSSLTQKRPYGIKRLAIILYSLGYDINDPIVVDVRRNDARFKYPPKNAIPYDKIRKKLESSRQRKRRTLSLDGKIALLGGSQRAEVRRFVDDLLQQSSPS